MSKDNWNGVCTFAALFYDLRLRVGDCVYLLEKQKENY
jgi:hypothetical protein